MRNRFKTEILRVATSAPMSPVHRRLVGDSVAVFMLHRFEFPELGVPGHSPAVIARFLEWIRKRGFRTWSLEALAAAIEEGRPLGGGVCFTVDDAYTDFGAVGAQVFESYDCPVTVFLPVDFVDQKGWMWWDQIAHMMDRTSRSTVAHPRSRPRDVDEPRDAAPLPVTDRPGKRTAVASWTEALKPLPEVRRTVLMEELAERLDVLVPTGVPIPKYRGMTWDALRASARSGVVTYGPHTLSHPWMAALSRAELRHEVQGSWKRLRHEFDSPVPVFCYPYGTAASLPTGADALFRGEGLVASVTAMTGIVSGSAARVSPFSLPRIGWADDLLDARQVTTGILSLRDGNAWSALRDLVGRV